MSDVYAVSGTGRVIFLLVNDSVCFLKVCVFALFFFQAEDGIRDVAVTGVQTCALPISGDVHVTGKLTVDGAIDPTWVRVNGTTSDTYYEATDGQLDPVSNANEGRLRYNEIGRASCRERV